MNFNISGNKSQSISMSNGKVKVNGQTINVPKNASISMKNGKLYVDGKLSEDFVDKTVNLIINGDVGSVTTDCPVECQNVLGNVTAGSYVECNDVTGNVESGSYVEAEVIKGSVKAGAYIEYNGK